MLLFSRWIAGVEAAICRRGFMIPTHHYSGAPLDYTDLCN
jgi:hypothetical protein